MALIDEILPLTTFVVFMGGNSGQMIVEMIRKHPGFADYDRLTLADDGSWMRPVFMPYNYKQYATRFMHADLIHGVPGPMSWIPSEENKTWLRAQTEDWFTKVWERASVVDLRHVLDNGLRIAMPTHQSAEFLDWVMPESKKLFVVDRNSYFSVRADHAKNRDKHPKDSMELIRYVAERVAINRSWNQEGDFDLPNSMRVVRSDLISDDRGAHDRVMSSIMGLHGFTMDGDARDAAWDMVRDYMAAQRRLGYVV